MRNRSIRSSRWLWAASALVLFIAFGFVDWVPEGKAGAYWPTLTFLLPRVFAGEYAARAAIENCLPLIIWGCFLGTVAIIIGWVVQAVLLVIRAALIKTEPRDATLSPPV